jgi:polysaccharide pyruvyl transferase WcaK-like protein
VSGENDLAHRLTLRADTLPAVREPASRQAERSAKPATIALFGLFGCGNLGNDASLEAMIDFLRSARPDASLFCVCHEPDLVAKTFSIETVPINWSRHLTGSMRTLNRLFLKIPGKLADLAQTLRYIRSADVMIIPGTGILDDFGERPHGMPLDILRWCLAARIVGAKVAFVSIGAGPIRNRLSLWLMTAAARLAHYRSYRDNLSKDFMEGVGFDASRDPVYPDVVFRLPSPDVRSVKRSHSGHLIVGVGVMSYYGWYGYAEGGKAIFSAYIGKLAEFVTYLLDKGHDVRLLTGELGDKIAVDALVTAVRQARRDVSEERIVAEPSFSLHDLMRQMSGTDLVVATRFHNIVCALKLGKPTISLGYAKKNDVLMAEMGLAEYCQHVEHFEIGALIDQFEAMMHRRKDYQAQLAEHNRRFRQQLDEQEAFLMSEYLDPR